MNKHLGERLITLLWAILLVGCGGEGSGSTAGDTSADSVDPHGQASSPATTIRAGTAQPLQTFDPHLSHSGPAFSTYLTLVYDGLTVSTSRTLDEDPEPNLASSWRWLDDRTLEFELLRNVHFSDGERFDAAAAKANIDRMLSLRGPRYNTVATIDRAEVRDEFTLRLHLNSPDATLLGNLSQPPGMMISPAAFDNDDLDLNPVGTGPFIYDAQGSTLKVVHRFRVNQGYHGGVDADAGNFEIHVLPNSRARLNTLIAGQIDLAVLGPAEAAPALERGFEIARRANRWFGMTVLDRKGELVPEFADPRVRRAIGFAVDRKAIADVVFFGFARPASQPMAKGLGYVQSLDGFYGYDPAAARALLDEAGVDRLTFTAPVDPTETPRFEAVQAYLKKVGIDMEIAVIEPGTIGALARTRRYPVNTIGFPNYDPDNRHPAIWGETATFNPFQTRNEVLESSAIRARETVDETIREAAFEDYFNTIVADAHSIIFLQVSDLVAFDPKKLKSVHVGRYIDPILREVRLNRISSAAMAATTGCAGESCCAGSPCCAGESCCAGAPCCADAPCCEGESC